MAALRALISAVALVVTTPFLGMVVVIAAIFRMKDRPGSPHDWIPRWWGRTQLWVAGVRIVEHASEHKRGAQHVFVANHLGFFDVFALAAVLPRAKFVAKAELFRLPILGRAMLATGMVPIERANRKAAFGSYSVATARAQDGASVIVYPEGTRGTAYPLRPFKKGPFVLAIQAQVPVVPVVVHGVLEVQRKGTFGVRPGVLHLHYLPPIPTAGVTYEERDDVARRTYEAMAACLEREYGVVSPPYGSGRAQ